MKIRDAVSCCMYWFPLVLLFLLGFSACEDYFLPQLEEFENVLVVDGAISNLPGPYTIQLSFSSGIYSNDRIPVEGAIVTIMEQGGDQEVLTENQAGNYRTSDNGIQGTEGKSYKIHIQLPDGAEYESEYQTMPATIPIDSVEARLEYRFLSLEEPDVPVYQFYVTSEVAENSENYLVWFPEATYKYEADFTLDFTFSENGFEPYPNPTEFMTCWRTGRVSEIFTFNTAFLTQPKIEQLPLHFVRADQRELSIRYSLLVKQLTVSEEAYTFWNNLQNLIESQESLYNTQPFQIRGNIYNVDDPDETVLGYFLVAGQNEKRIFVDHPEDLNLTPFSYCFPDYMGMALIGFYPPTVYPIYIYEDEADRRALGNEECFDCRELGGTITEPEFWEE